MLTRSFPMLGRGHIDACVPFGDRASIAGYYQLLRPAAVTGYEAEVDGRPVPVVRVHAGQPSPDIAALAHCRVLPDADRCRFQLELGVRYEDVPPHGLITLRPLTAEGPALGLRLLHQPTTSRPDEAAITSVGGGYEAVAQEFLTYMVDLAGLAPRCRVLEAGCGIGRMALGLSAYLDTGPGGGRYVGLDVMRPAIEAARATFRGHRAEPRLRFVHLDVHNGWYNPKGILRTQDVRFADYVEEPVDFVLMSSLLTHLFPADAAHYLAQCRSVLDRDGVVLATSWIMDERTKAATRAGASAIPFQERDGYWVHSDTNPEGALAHEEAFLLGAIRDAGLAVAQRIPGFWSGGVGLAFQDILVLRRADAPSPARPRG